MPMGPAELTLAKLNSYLGGVGGEWGSEEGPKGAAVPTAVRSQARQLGNQGQTAAAAAILLQGALGAGARLPASLLDEIQQNFGGDQAVLSTVAGLRGLSASGPAKAAGGGKPGLFSRLFGRG